MNVLMPDTVNAAVSMLAEHGGNAVPIAGGTDLFVNWPQRFVEHDKVYVDLSKLEELRKHRWEDGWLVLGALTTYWDVVSDPKAREVFPTLVAAAQTVGAVQIQTRGTWAGNIINASPAADGVLALMSLDAVVGLTSSVGVEEVRLDEFYLGYKKFRRASDQLITSIKIPIQTRTFESFVKVGSRNAQAITKVGLALAHLNHSNAGWRVVANSMAPTVRRCAAIEKMLDDEVYAPRPESFMDAINEDLSPIDDIRSTSIYRGRALAQVLYHELLPVCTWVGPKGGAT